MVQGSRSFRWTRIIPVFPGLAPVLIIAAMPPTDLHAQEPTPASPAEAVEAAFRAEEAGDWTRFLALIHPEALAEFKRALLRNRETEEFILEHADAYPVPVDREMFRRQHQSFLRAVFGVDSWEEADRLPPGELFARYLGSGRAAPQETEPPALPQDPGAEPRTILGAVAEGDTVAHVVFREVDFMPAGPLKLGPIPEAQLERKERIRVVTAKRAPEGWRVMLNGGLFFQEGGGFAIGYGFPEGEQEGDAEP